MRKLKFMIAAVLFAAIVGALPTVSAATAAASAANIEVSAVSAYAMEMTTGTEIFAKNERERRPIASMAKIMTLNLIFDAITAGELQMSDMISVSQNAASMGGSQAFLDANNTYKTEDLIGSIIIASANDSCVALAEHLAGSVEGFVSRMNERAADLGMADTYFANCTGLPAPNHYSCAKDVATMSRELYKHNEYFKFSGTWMKDFAHPSGRITGLTNTNKLIRSLQGCDGGKTGYTREAGFCISATAQREGMRLIGVVMGGNDSATRFSDAGKLINHGFANFAMDKAVSIGDVYGEVGVKGGREKTVPVIAEQNFDVFRERGNKSEISLKSVLDERLSAPVAKGQKAGTLYVIRDGQVLGEVALVAAQDVDAKTFKDAWKDVISHF